MFTVLLVKLIKLHVILL